MRLEEYKKIINEDFSKEADLIDHVIKELGMKKNAKILDIGTGFGGMSILLALNGYTVLTGQPKNDPEWKEITQQNNNHTHNQEHFHYEFPRSDWKENAKALDVFDKITFQSLNAENLSFVDETFDAIFLYDSLQHIENRDVALDECIRVMKKDGVICVIEWNKKSIKKDEEKHGFKIDYVDPREIMDRIDVTIELISGNFVNIFKIRKKSGITNTQS